MKITQYNGYADFVKITIKTHKFTLFHQILSIVFSKIVSFLKLILVPSKIVPALILFLIDISGSMTASL